MRADVLFDIRVSGSENCIIPIHIRIRELLKFDIRSITELLPCLLSCFVSGLQPSEYDRKSQRILFAASASLFQVPVLLSIPFSGQKFISVVEALEMLSGASIAIDTDAAGYLIWPSGRGLKQFKKKRSE